MRDFAVSEHPGVQAQLDRLGALSLPKGRLGLEVKVGVGVGVGVELWMLLIIHNQRAMTI